MHNNNAGLELIKGVHLSQHCALFVIFTLWDGENIIFSSYNASVCISSINRSSLYFYTVVFNYYTHMPPSYGTKGDVGCLGPI